MKNANNKGASKIKTSPHFKTVVTSIGHDQEKVLGPIRQLEWKHWLNRPYSPFWATFFWAGITEKYFKKVGFEYFADGSHLYQYPDMYYSIAYEKKSDQWAKHFFATNRVSRLTAMIEKTHQKNMLDLGKLLASSDDIEIRVGKFFEGCMLYASYLWLVLPLENYFKLQIEKKFKKYYPDNYKTIAADLSTPIKKTVYEKMIEELIAGVAVKEVKNKYGWLKSRDGFSAFYSAKDLEEIKLNHRSSMIDHAKNIKYPKSLSILVEDLRELTFFRTDRTDKFYEYLNGGRPLFKLLAEKLNIRYSQLKYYDSLMLLKGEKIKYAKIFSYALYHDKYAVSNGPFIADLNKHDLDKVRGHAAYLGVVRGRAKVILHASELKKIAKGDILVTQMTFPSFISAMQKAAAFVTDEGGITCHAAIIAREMKKPCIIATKNATKVLKDGDLVEVDADNGVVRIITK